ncbi:MAG: hypothetical protein U0X87_10285 [Anaerolineales bacterium]
MRRWARWKYSFDNIETPANRIFVANVTDDGVSLQSGFAVVEGKQLVEIPALTLYETTEDTSGLALDGEQIIFDYGADAISVYSLYSFRNPTDKIIVVPQDETGQISFIKFPEGSSGFGFEPMQDSEAFVPTENDSPFRRARNLTAWSRSSLALDDTVKFSQSFALPVASLNVFTPIGVTVEDSKMVDLGKQTIQGLEYQIYESDAIAAGESIQFTLSGSPSGETSANTSRNIGLLIGAAALGLAFIGAGWWMYRQDKRAEPSDEESSDEFESAEDVMDAIIALDDLHGRKKISESAYRKRRSELKEILKKVEN